MDQPWVDILKSRIFTFVIGPNQEEFAVHASALAQVSSPLKTLITGGMKEAQEGRVEWPDIDAPTFGRFMQWVYTQNYDTPEPTVDATAEPELHLASLSANNTSEIEHVDSLPGQCPDCGSQLFTEQRSCKSCKTKFEADVCDNDGSDHFCKTCCSKYPTKCPQCDEQYIGTTGRERLVQKFRGGSNPEPIKASANEFQAREKKDSTEDYGDLFLCHAKLYVLGDKYLIPELKKLATHRLHATLEAFTLYPSRPRDVFGLVEYTFENVHPADEICGVLSLYCACNVESLDVNGVEELERLITEVPSFGLSLVRSMR